jgi:hypothetical protein
MGTIWGRNYRSKLKFGAALLAGGLPSGALLGLLYEVFGILEPWMWYLCGCVFYTVTVFTDAYIDDDSTLFSESDHRSKIKLLTVHLGYVCVLFLLIQLALYLRPHLPQPMPLRGKSGISWGEFALIAAIFLVYFVEEDWLIGKKK